MPGIPPVSATARSPPAANSPDHLLTQLGHVTPPGVGVENIREVFLHDQGKSRPQIRQAAVIG